MTFARLLLGFVCVLGVLGTQRPADARAFPRFDWAECTWYATHVVVARHEGSKKDRYTVLESWSGPSLVGSELHLPPKPGCVAAAERTAGPDTPLTGTRMVLFLMRDEAKGAWTLAEDWRCWIEGGQAYSYV